MSPMQTQPKDSATILAFERQQATFLLKVHKIKVKRAFILQSCLWKRWADAPRTGPNRSRGFASLQPGSVSAEPAVTVKIPDPVKGS